MDAEGLVRWIVDYIVGHEDPLAKQRRRLGRRARFYPLASIVYDDSVLHPQDTWEPCSLLLLDLPDVVQAYELIKSSHPDLSANVNALVMNASDEAMHDVGNENDVEIETVVITGFCHDQ